MYALTAYDLSFWDGLRAITSRVSDCYVWMPRYFKNIPGHQKVMVRISKYETKQAKIHSFSCR